MLSNLLFFLFRLLVCFFVLLYHHLLLFSSLSSSSSSSFFFFLLKGRRVHICRVTEQRAAVSRRERHWPDRMCVSCARNTDSRKLARELLRRCSCRCCSDTFSSCIQLGGRVAARLRQSPLWGHSRHPVRRTGARRRRARLSKDKERINEWNTYCWKRNVAGCGSAQVVPCISVAKSASGRRGGWCLFLLLSPFSFLRVFMKALVHPFFFTEPLPAHHSQLPAPEPRRVCRNLVKWPNETVELIQRQQWVSKGRKDCCPTISHWFTRSFLARASIGYVCLFYFCVCFCSCFCFCFFFFFPTCGTFFFFVCLSF